MSTNIKSNDPVILAEFILVCLATLFLVGNAFLYIAFSKISFWGWFITIFFIVIKSWLEFFETHADRRMTDLAEYELPNRQRRQGEKNYESHW